MSTAKMDNKVSLQHRKIHKNHCCASLEAQLVQELAGITAYIA